MGKSITVLILGIFVAILPYLGFPYSWKDVLETLSGLAIAYTAYMLYRELKAGESASEKTFENFSENKFEDQEK